MTMFFLNTDAKTNGVSYHDEWFARRIAVTSGPEKFCRKLARIGRLETVLMYVNHLGVVGAGTILDDEPVLVTDKASQVSPVEDLEYHRQVDWHSDLRLAPIGMEMLSRLCGRPPRHSVERVVKGERALSRLFDRGQRRSARALSAPPSRVQSTVSRIVRDTAKAIQVKQLHGSRCQICGHSIVLGDGSKYAEGHHIRPLGSLHDGPDVLSNIVCLCPNHHAACDLGAIRLSRAKLRQVNGHLIGQEFIGYHNDRIFQKC